MTAGAPSPPASPGRAHWTEGRWLGVLRGRRGRPLGLLLLAVLVALLLGPEPSLLRAARLAAFDAYHLLAPRTPASEPAVIVAIDEASLAGHGQWPWPRTTLARLVDRIAEGRPAAIGIDVVMPEPDRLSPHRLPSLVPGIDADLAARLARVPSNDTQLARALRDRRVVVGVAGLEAPAPQAAAARGRHAPFREFGGDARGFVRRFETALRNVEEIESAAAGHGLISADAEAGVVRRLPLVAVVGGTLMPSLGLELLRVASGEPAITVRTGSRGVESVGLGALTVPTDRDGRVWLHYTRHRPERFVSAHDVLAGRVDPARFTHRVVLVGVTALGLADYQATPVVDRMSGLELHAQLIENIVDGALLARPRWLRGLEAALLLAGGLALIALVPRLPARGSAILALLVVAGPFALGLLLYLGSHVLFDAVTPALGLGVLFTAMLGVTLADTEAQRRALGRLVAAQREAAARLAGEMEAARRIQMGMLPEPATALGGDRRLSMYAFLEPALVVGGDFYEVLRLDADRIFFMVGDVSGKGLPGSLFMAVSKTLYKSTALRRGGAVAAMMCEANVEVSRDNPEDLFVTVFAGILDARTGEIEYCNAGHETPTLLPPGGGASAHLPLDGGGPPLCVLEEFAYTAGRYRLRPGEALCLVTDGVTEARSATGQFYGRGRLDRLLEGVGAKAGAETLGRAARDDVERFAEGAAPSDDLTIMVVQWHGPAG